MGLSFNFPDSGLVLELGLPDHILIRNNTSETEKELAEATGVKLPNVGIFEKTKFTIAGCIIGPKKADGCYRYSYVDIKFSLEYTNSYPTDWVFSYYGEGGVELDVNSLFTNAGFDKSQNYAYLHIISAFYRGESENEDHYATFNRVDFPCDDESFISASGTEIKCVYAESPTFVSADLVTDTYLIEGDTVVCSAIVKPINDSGGTISKVWMANTPSITTNQIPDKALEIGGTAFDDNEISSTFDITVPKYSLTKSSKYKNRELNADNFSAYCLARVPRSYVGQSPFAGFSEECFKLSFHAYDELEASWNLTRCTKSGELAEDGTCAKVSLSFIADALAGADSADRPNPVTAKVTATDGTNVHEQSFSLGNATGEQTAKDLVFNAATLSANKSYAVTVSVTDSVGSTATSTSTLPVSFFLMDFDGTGGKAIGIGQEAVEGATGTSGNGQLDISMDTKLHAPVTMDSTLTVGGAISAPYLVGSIQMYGGATAPSGWLLCDGSAVSRTTYSALFKVIGTAYGAGDGSTTFNVPNFSGRFPIGHCNTAPSTNSASCGYQGGSNPYPRSSDTLGWFGLGEAGGEDSHVLTTAEMPSHNHSYTLWSNARTVKSGSGTTFDQMRWWSNSESTLNLNTNYSGSNNAFHKMPPFLAVNYIIYAG